MNTFNKELFIDSAMAGAFIVTVLLVSMSVIEKVLL